MSSRSEADGLKAMTSNDINVLSVGISTGGDAEIRMLEANHDRRVTATTLDQSGLYDFQYKLTENSFANRCELRLEDISDPALDYKEEAFDFVYARLVLHYLPAQQLEVALKSIHRILKDSGKLFVVVRSSDTPELSPENIVSYDEMTRLTTYRSSTEKIATRYFHTPETITAALTENNFTIEHIDTFEEDLSPGFIRNTGIWVKNNLIEVIARK